MENELLADVAAVLRSGKQILRIEKIAYLPDRNPKCFAFHLHDGTKEVHEYNCDGTIFMNWWHQSCAYLRAAWSNFKIDP